MFKNHFKIAFRQLSRNKVFSGLNILGLSLGMALAILITLFIRNEFSIDRWMPDLENTYRVYRIGERGETAWTPPQLANLMATDYPEVEQTTGYAPNGENLVTYEGQNWYIEETAVVDSTFFTVLNLSFLKGDRNTVLDEPNSMVISNDLAKRIFGDKDPIGEVITYAGEYEYIIKGILDDQSEKSHINADMYFRFYYYGDFWGSNNRSTYVKLKDGSDPTLLAQKIEKDVNELIRQEHLARNYIPTEKDFYKWHLQPLNEVYLYSEGWVALGEQGSIRNVYILAIIALIIMLVAIINYINLTTARSSQRGREVGVRKVAGASKGLLAAQFISESVLQSVFAGVIAIVIAQVTVPIFGRITNRELALVESEQGWVILLTLGLAILTGILAGIYPAFILTSFKPVSALKSSFMDIGGKGSFRKVLVTGQFAVSIILLIVMSFIYRQVNFMLHEDLGFQPDKVIKIPLNEDNAFRRIDQLRSEIKRISGVQEITTASSLPGGPLPDWGMFIQGREDRIAPRALMCGPNFANTLDIELKEGRFFNSQIAGDSLDNYIVNEKFVKEYQLDNPVGQRIKWSNDTTYGQIVGVIKDFHFLGLADEIDPLVMMGGDWRSEAGIKISTENLSATIKELEVLWTQIEPNYPMRYSFVDAEFAMQYEEQVRFGQTILYSTLLTLFIALLGLFGLTSFNVERRIKEIGIRKVLGASVTGIITLLAKDFMKLLGFAFLIAIPIGYYLSNHWLSDFANRTEMAWWIFAGAGLVTLLAGFSTVCVQSLKAAVSNPIKSLKSE